MKNPYICDVTKDEMLHYINNMLTAYYGVQTVAGSKIRSLKKAQLEVVYQVCYLWRNDPLDYRMMAYNDVVKELVG